MNLAKPINLQIETTVFSGFFIINLMHVSSLNEFNSIIGSLRKEYHMQIVSLGHINVRNVFSKFQQKFCSL